MGLWKPPASRKLSIWPMNSGLDLDIYAISFYLGRESLLTTGTGKMARWRKGLFGFLSRNAWNVSTYFGIPPGRVVELGSQVEL